MAPRMTDRRRAPLAMLLLIILDAVVSPPGSWAQGGSLEAPEGSSAGRDSSDASDETAETEADQNRALFRDKGFSFIAVFEYKSQWLQSKQREEVFRRTYEKAVTDATRLLGISYANATVQEFTSWEGNEAVALGTDLRFTNEYDTALAYVVFTKNPGLIEGTMVDAIGRFTLSNFQSTYELFQHANGQ